MTISVFDLFSIGIGPSSSHTVGPMRAAKAFVDLLKQKELLNKITQVKVELYGSLALTGKGHGTDIAILLGLEGHTPEDIEPDYVQPRVAEIRQHHQLNLAGIQLISFKEKEDLLFHKDQLLPMHSNGMCFSAYNYENNLIDSRVYYSVGGGFIVDSASFNRTESNTEEESVPYPFTSGAELLAHCQNANLSISEVMMANEKTWRSQEEIESGIKKIWKTMNQAIDHGCHTQGVLPGGLNVRRRAPALFAKLEMQGDSALEVNWLSLYAIAVNEENAAGGRIVTAPTNGAAGTIPSVLRYYTEFCEGANEKGIIDFILTAGAIGILYKERASISAAEVGCQGEVGVACSMAAAGLAAALGATPAQIENAAEIGMEHHLGLTCDPVGGLVQIPCIERNAMGAVQAVTSANLALLEEGEHKISLDAVIKTMRETGKDMMTKYKETSEGGLAVHTPVNIPEC
jgi:L-serine dehydratase